MDYSNLGQFTAEGRFGKLSFRERLLGLVQHSRSRQLVQRSRTYCPEDSQQGREARRVCQIVSISDCPRLGSSASRIISVSDHQHLGWSALRIVRAPECQDCQHPGLSTSWMFYASSTEQRYCLLLDRIKVLSAIRGAQLGLLVFRAASVLNHQRPGLSASQIVCVSNHWHPGLSTSRMSYVTDAGPPGR